MRPNDGMPSEVAASEASRSAPAGWRGRRRALRWPDIAWPPPADDEALGRFREDFAARWEENGLAPALLAAMREAPGVTALLDCIGGNSPYLADLVLRSPPDFAELLANGPDSFAETTLSEIDDLPPDGPRDTLAAAMRRAKNRIALTCALADIGGCWPLETVTQTLSRLAESTLDAAVRHLLRSAYDGGRLSLKDPGRPTRGSGYVVLAMGKLGARELNFSSDIDLVVLFDASLHADPDSARQIFIRMTSDLVRLMEARDANGYVFRTDLRLRPDPAATPLAVSLPAAIAYYESLGQTWERAAMTKARPVAGNIRLGRSFLKAIHPFVWRRHLDFALIDDIHVMKAKIDQHRKPGRSGLARMADSSLTDPEAGAHWLLGHNVKLGEGGIREIEFVAQAMQLVWGGRTPSLRDPTTLGALRILTRSGHMPREEAEMLARAYRLLREVEHRVQMRDDRQTHRLPETEERFSELATFLGYASGGDFALDLLPQMRAARRIFEKHFSTPTRQIRPEEALLDLEIDELPARLGGLGFPQSDCDAAATILSHWSGNSRRALRSERAHALLRRLMPDLLASFIARRDPLACLRHFDTLLSRQRAGVQLLSLLERNLALIDRIAAIFDASPFLANHLADTPSALEGLLELQEEENLPPATSLAPEQVRLLAAEKPDLEMLVTRLRPVVRAEEFRLSVARLEGRLDEDTAAGDRTAVADAVMGALLENVFRAHRTRHGQVEGGGIAVMALGKAGSREMMAGSDLDLMMIFDHPEDVTESTPLAMGTGRPLPVSQYYLRLAHSFIAALTAPDSEGPLYPVDMRLRPSGAAGPVAVSLSAFRRYQAEESWTWERMALTRARIVTQVGESGVRSRLKKVLLADLDAALGSGPRRDPDTIRADAAAMRARLARDLPPSSPWDVKRRAGGLMEVEFIAQTLQLIAGTAKARSPVTSRAFELLARARLLSPADARLLIDADERWRSLQSLLRLLCGPKPPEDPAQQLPAATLDVLCRSMDVPGVSALREEIETLAATVRVLFIRLIGPVET
ncbi:bifunctional [glutamine synthetase] adenylyltransferase/[glutamine synthetase]-adenylyl-L-tyrosine phosphorylase [Acetobacter conturbans]|uniref:Bifunctional [glutamine synthetase] adenylyltransferase/[glutamine synthetase]-adenylyl-L-tyrosine phosphorylase n=1 Tax=Acetobacter conturbans TaxID=1737472 RepID=A0ABX0JYC8_9PROT|nr:bifunctional [glutamine synthetase] adenylyltransferase/[glutamine synthetase]-adenylyl-L-tyrosine phosphorylase [Acetobacter conturbans]NHN88379.1 bifunctional [glutamine synthetase] adenylyltransferase/[glutamine synthetase]-adenylyl-L-tyrosine phosphorylase [Acetobacter conturbans]